MRLGSKRLEVLIHLTSRGFGWLTLLFVFIEKVMEPSQIKVTALATQPEEGFSPRNHVVGKKNKLPKVVL